MEKELYYRAVYDKIFRMERIKESGQYKITHIYTDPFGRNLPKQGEVSKGYVDWLLSNKKG